MLAPNHFHISMHNFFKNKELSELYFSVAIKSFVESLIQIFVPIYLYRLGFGISDIALYYLIYFTAVAILMPICMRMNSWFGIKKVLTIGTFAHAIYYLLLMVLANGALPYYAVALLYGASVALYCSAFHLEFSTVSDKNREAREISGIRIMMTVATSLGPLIGALFISEFSFEKIFFIVPILLLVSVIPLFFTKDKKIKIPQFSIKNVMKADTIPKAISHQANGIMDIAGLVFWPLFIYLTLLRVFSLGVIISATSILMVISLLIIGRSSDRKWKTILKTGVITHSISWISRLIFLSPFGIFLNNLYASVSYLMIEIPYSKYLYQKSKNTKHISNYFLFREFNLATGRVIILLIAFLTGSIYWTFIVSFFATYLFLFLLKK